MIPRFFLLPPPPPRRSRPVGPRQLLATWALGALVAAVLGLSHGAQAEPEPGGAYADQILGTHPAPIPRAIGIYLTQRGQNYFRANLRDLIARHGYELGDGGFEGWHYQAEETIQLDHLPAPILPFAGPLGSLRELIRRWLVHAQVGDPLISADLSQIAYSAEPTEFGLEADPEATAATMGDRGVVLVFRAEIPKIRVQASAVAAHDLNNAFLGQFGADTPSLDLSSGAGEPLRVSVPFSLQLDSAGGVRFEMLAIRTNLADIGLDLCLGPAGAGPQDACSAQEPRHLRLPAVRVRVNGYPMTLNPERLAQELLDLKPGLLKAAQTYLSLYLSSYAPAKINQLVRDKVSNHLFSDVNEMDPPSGARPAAPQDRYRWGVTPEEVHLTRDYLMLGLSGFVEDPRSRTPYAEVSRRQVSRPPALNLLDTRSFDAALTISEDVVNRVLALDYLRGYIPTLDVAGSAPLRILQAPEFHFNSDRDRGTLHLKVMHKVQGLEESIAMRGEVTFEMDVSARLVHTARGKLSVVVDQVDTRSLNIDNRTVHGLFQGMVHGRILKDLEDTNRQLRTQPKVIVDALPVPTQLEGIPIRIKDFRADPNGYLVLYTDFDLSR